MMIWILEPTEIISWTFVALAHERNLGLLQNLSSMTRQGLLETSTPKCSWTGGRAMKRFRPSGDSEGTTSTKEDTASTTSHWSLKIKATYISHLSSKCYLEEGGDAPYPALPEASKQDMNSLRIETLSSITTSNICIPYNYVKLHMISYNTPIIFQNPLTHSEKAWKRWASLLTPQPKPMGPSSQGARPWAQWPVRCGSHEPPRVGHLRGHNDGDGNSQKMWTCVDTLICNSWMNPL